VHIALGNAPCSWGVEFADDPRNPSWLRVLDEVAAAGYDGVELGPIGFMPEDPIVLGSALAERGLRLTAGAVFQPFHDPAAWDQVREAARRTGRTLAAHGAEHMVLVDSISETRARTAGRSAEAPRLAGAELNGFLDRIRTAAAIGVDEFGLTVSIHAHAASFVEFEDELECVLAAVEPRLLGICLDTGHFTYAGFDPVAFYERHAVRVNYLHLKDVDPQVRVNVIEHRVRFHDTWKLGLFCTLGQGEVDFAGLRTALDANGYSGWATVEHEWDPAGERVPLDDARADLAALVALGIA
jgi:inosose dehydratase